MSDHTQHLSDEFLLLMVDDELSPRERPAVERHLAACSRCRARLQTIGAALAEGADAYCHEDAEDPHGPERLRARLRANLTDLSNELDRSWQVRFVQTLARVPSVAVIGSAVVAVMVLLAVWHTRQASVASAPVIASVESGALPVRWLTPGATGPVTADELCTEPTPDAAPIPARVRQAILHDYRMEDVPADEYELDYLITPALGGAADRRNLWPERYGSRVWNARVKDELEDLLPDLVCHGRLDLGTAQRDIAANWINAYKKYFHTDRPVHRQTSNAGERPLALAHGLGLDHSTRLLVALVAGRGRGPAWLD